MKAPLSWLRELTPLSASPGDRSAVAELASEMDALGLVVAGVEQVGEGLDQVVLARVLQIAPIEGADRIRRVVVDRGGGEAVEVVCGAWNFAEGDLVALAPPGTELPGGVRIERRKMRGVTSNGMLCSPKELALSEESDGILVLSSAETEERLGSPLAEHLGFSSDVVFDLEIEANRPDCLSIAGIARDLAGRYGLPLELPEPEVEETGPAVGELASVEIADADLCPELLARALTAVRPAQSPAWLQRRLLLCGMRPINHVVDASNYVMLELGQPTHPYDLDGLGGGGLRVRAARPGERLVTLDGVERILGSRPSRGGDEGSSRDLLICDGEDVPVGVAGVIGGRSSEIGEATGRVLLEVARFDGTAVGRTARYLGLRTEASVRFERGVDPEGLERAAARFCQLVREAAVASGVEPPAIATGTVRAVPYPFARRHVRVRPASVNALLGLELEPVEMASLIDPIGFALAGAGPGRPAAGEPSEAVLEVVVPPWRPDVTGEHDVTEEVARLYGYQRIPRRERRSPFVGRLDARQRLRRRLRLLMAGLLADEALSSSLSDPAAQRLAGCSQSLVPVANPMAAEESVLRGGLLAGLLEALRRNSGHQNPWIRLFEIGDVFRLTDASARRSVHESERVALLLAFEGDGAAEAARAWQVVADALGLVDSELRQAWSDRPGTEGGGEAGAPRALEIKGALAGLHPTRSGVLFAGGQSLVLGTLGEVDPAVLAGFGLAHERVGWLELSVDSLLAAPRRPAAAVAVSRFPPADVDLAFTLDEAISAQRLEALLRAAGKPLLESVRLFDVYRGEGLEPGRRSLAYRLRFRAPDRTLTDEDVAALRGRCIEAATALAAELRGTGS